MFASLDGLVVHYTLSGRPDGLPLAFINSLGTDLRLWDPVVPGLESDCAILRYDLRGHGLTDCPPGPYRLAQLAEDLRSLLHHLGIERAVLIGISIGGLIALQFAASYPGAVRSLILADTAARIGSPDRWEQRIEAVRREGLEGVADTVVNIWLSESFRAGQPALTRGYRNMLTRMPAEGYIACCSVLAESDLSPRLTTIRAPALVLSGESDPATPPEQGRALAAALPDAQFELVPAAAHLPCIEQPDRVAAFIRLFLQERGHG